MSPRPSVALLDYGSGNVHSAAKALDAAGADVTVTAERRALREADGLVVPGVGAFAAVAAALARVGGGDIVDRRLAGGRAVLGICVGMQVLFDSGDERGAEAEGLGQWPGHVERLTAPVLPHTGWSRVEPAAGSTLFAGLRDERFYFVHSYAARQWLLPEQSPYPPPRVTWAQHGERFVAAAETGPLAATQFHPEKSGAAGIRLLANWIESL